MASGNRILIPSFLQKADDYLLRHKPVIWQSRIHLLTWYYLLAALLIAGLSYISSGDPRSGNGLGGWTTFTILMTILAFVGWLIYLLRFNVFKRFGQWHSTDALLSFSLLFLGGFMIISLNFIPAAIQTWKTSQHYGREEIVQDMNEINALALQLEYAFVPKEWTADTTVLGEAPVIRVTENESANDTLAIQPVVYQHNWSYVDSLQLKRKLTDADSVVILGNNRYVFYTPPNYQFVSNYHAPRYAKTKILSSADLYRLYLVKPPVINRTEMNTRLRELSAKWADPDERNYYGYYDTDYLNRIRRKYDLYKTDDGLNHVADKRFDWDENGTTYLRVCYYFSLYLILLVFGFRHSTARTFFMSLLTLLVLSILTGLMLVMSASNTEISLFYFLLFYYLLFAALSVAVFSATRRSLAQGIALNIFTWATPIFPLILTKIYLYATAYPYNEWVLSAEALEKRDHLVQQLWLLAEWAGPVLFLLLLQWLLRKLYRRWYALPTD